LGGGWFGVLPFDVFVWLPRKMCKYFWIDRYWGFCFLLNYGLCLMKLEQKKCLRLMKEMCLGLSHNIEFSTEFVESGLVWFVSLVLFWKTFWWWFLFACNFCCL
jgi:hypothetical protein